MKPDTGGIPLSEEDYHPRSFGDPNGRLFWWQGQLYRGIKKQMDLYRQLFKNGLIQDLIDRGLLVQTEIADVAFENYQLVLKHRSIPFVSYLFEWSAEMIKDATLLVVDLEMELASHGLTLQDANPSNVLFDRCRPVWVDFCSIVPANNERSWGAYDEFCHFFLYPLYLMAHGQGRIARCLLRDINEGVLESDFANLIHLSSWGFSTTRAVRRLLPVVKQRVPRRLRQTLEKGFTSLEPTLSTLTSRIDRSQIAHLRQLRQEIEDVVIPSRPADRTGYDDDHYATFPPSDKWTQKQRSVYEVLSNLRPSSVLDAGCNFGRYSLLAASLGSKVAAFDMDDACVAQLYHDARVGNLPISPLVMDFRNPSPGLGLCNQWLAPATQRLRCEMVLALALVHHLVFKRQLNFENIVKGLSLFSSRWLLVEFIPPEDQSVKELWSEQYSWYTLEEFIWALKREFHGVRIFPSYPDPGILLLCEK